MSAIPINRSGGREALKQLVKHGKDRLARGLWVVIFPEGTRVEPGARGKYHIGGAWLASHTESTVVPVAHNAGLFWRKNAFIKQAGNITVSIGKPIETAGLKADEVNTVSYTHLDVYKRQGLSLGKPPTCSPAVAQKMAVMVKTQTGYNIITNIK